jgi:hypothetical protein
MKRHAMTSNSREKNGKNMFACAWWVHMLSLPSSSDEAARPKKKSKMKNGNGNATCLIKGVK